MPKPTRIASLLASATEILYGLGLGERVVAVSHECDWPPEVLGKPRVTRAYVDAGASSAAIDAQVHQMLAGGAPLYEIDSAQLARLAPQLIVTQAQCDVCAVRYADVVTCVAQHASLRGAQVVALNPASLDEILADVERVGRAAGASQEAACYTDALQARVDAIAGRTAASTPHQRPRVALIEWIAPLMLSGNWLPELVALAGGRHDLTTPCGPSIYVRFEELAAYDPQLIVIAPCGFDLERTLREVRPLAGLPGWQELAAVRTDRVFAVDGNAYFNRSGPRIVDTLEMLAHFIHPERFAPPACADEQQEAWCRFGGTQG